MTLMPKWLVCLMPLCAAGPSLAAPMPALDVQALISRSDTIVVGHIGAAAGGAEVSIDRVLKAESTVLGANSRLRLAVMEGFDPDWLAGGYGMFFVNCAGQSICAPADASYPALVAVPGMSAATTENLPTVQRVVEELVAVLATATPAQGLRSQAVTALATLPAAAAVPALLAAHSSASVSGRMGITAALVRLSEFSTLAEVQPQMLREADDLVASRRLIAYGMLYTKSPPATLVSPMTSWLLAKDVDVRRAAAYVLRGTRTAEAISPLLTVALSDADQMVRYYAVSGLVAISGRGQVPSLDTYRAAEGRYLDDWKSWGRRQSKPK
jgi:hypothetical protein